MIETLLNKKPNISGIFITHAHMGHYTGLMELGLEVLNTQNIPIYVMAKMKSFLEENCILDKSYFFGKKYFGRGNPSRSFEQHWPRV